MPLVWTSAKFQNIFCIDCNCQLITNTSTTSIASATVNTSGVVQLFFQKVWIDTVVEILSHCVNSLHYSIVAFLNRISFSLRHQQSALVTYEKVVMRNTHLKLACLPIGLPLLRVLGCALQSVLPPSQSCCKGISSCCTDSHIYENSHVWFVYC